MGRRELGIVSLEFGVPGNRVPGIPVSLEFLSVPEFPNVVYLRDLIERNYSF